MHDARRVSRRQSARTLNRDIEALDELQRRPSDALPPCLALNKLSREEIHRVDLLDFVNRDNVGMVEYGSSFRFLTEAPHAILIGSEISRKNLERNFAIQLRIL